jgi:hypothetical protein
MSGEDRVYAAEALSAFAAGLFRAAGLDDDKAATVAEVLLEGDLLGHTTHGLALAAPYLRAIEDGSMSRDGEPAWSATTAARSAGTAGGCPGRGWWSRRSIGDSRARPSTASPRSRSKRAITSPASPPTSSAPRHVAA